MAEKSVVGRPAAFVALEVVLWLLMPCVTAIAAVIMGLQAFGTVGCAGICRDDLVAAAYYILLAGLPFAFVVAVIMRIAWRRARRRTFLAPLVGLILLTAVFAMSYVTIEVGFAPMYERNERASTSATDATLLWEPSNTGSPDSSAPAAANPPTPPEPTASGYP